MDVQNGRAAQRQDCCAGMIADRKRHRARRNDRGTLPSDNRDRNLVIAAPRSQHSSDRVMTGKRFNAPAASCFGDQRSCWERCFPQRLRARDRTCTESEEKGSGSQPKRKSSSRFHNKHYYIPPFRAERADSTTPRENYTQQASGRFRFSWQDSSARRAKPHLAPKTGAAPTPIGLPASRCEGQLLLVGAGLAER